jgi:hypothetical protein
MEAMVVCLCGEHRRTLFDLKSVIKKEWQAIPVKVVLSKYLNFWKGSVSVIELLPLWQVQAISIACDVEPPA